MAGRQSGTKFMGMSTSSKTSEGEGGAEQLRCVALGKHFQSHMSVSSFEYRGAVQRCESNPSWSTDCTT